MKIFPQNLRDRQHAQIIRRRCWAAWGGTATTGTDAHLNADPPPPKLGKLGRIWKKGSGLTDEQAATGLPAASMSTQGTMWTISGILLPISWLLAGVLSAKGKVPVAETMSAMAAFTAATGYLSAITLPKLGLRSLYGKPLSITEVEGLLERTD